MADNVTIGGRVLGSVHYNVYRERKLPGKNEDYYLRVKDVDSLYASFVSSGKPIHTPMREVWRRYGDREGGRREFCVQDPDGYLVMMGEQIGVRPLS